MIKRIALVVLSLVAIYMVISVGQYFIYKSHALSFEDGEYTGNPNASVKVIEFLDYSCPQCRDLHPALQNAIERDSDVLFIPRPIFSQRKEGSAAAFAVYAAGLQGKFLEAHHYFLNNPIPEPDGFTAQIASDLGLNHEQFETDMGEKPSEERIEKNYLSLVHLGSESVPTLFISGPKSTFLFMVGDRLPTSDEIVQLFNVARTGE